MRLAVLAAGFGLSITVLGADPALIGVSAGAARSDGSDRRSLQRIEDPEVHAVYAAVAAAERHGAGAPVIVVAETYRHPYDPGDCVRATGQESNAWRVAIDDYVRRSQAERIVPRNPPATRALYVVLPLAEIRKRSRQSGADIGYLALSDVGFDTGRTRAIVHRVHASALGADGDGSDLFLEKQDGEWRLVKPAGVQGCGWIS
ncbi:MAG TPA: hypothetical protein VK886_24050 [Vicinamibacterales bacterium]|nr:hypothetical protein [Vicinamibacterales bacterium]